MCGILGIISKNNFSKDEAVLFENSLQSISHRGKDDEGYIAVDINKKHVEHYSGKYSSADTKQLYPSFNNFKYESYNILLAHKRLSIFDLSSLGHQPMSYLERNLFIIFNGEIFNYIEIREELINKGFVFKTKTDTEVVLASYLEWGEDCVKKFNGMWSFSILDLEQDLVFCSRDRFGIKPFYYLSRDNCFVFGSEIKSIYKFIDTRPNDKIIIDYLLGYEQHSSETFFEGILQLEPGNNILYDLKTYSFEIKNYYDLNQRINKSDILFEDAIEKYLKLFNDSVKLRSRSDIPIGFALSGGLDSTALVSVASEISNNDKLKTFSIVFKDKEANETKYIEDFLNDIDVESHLYEPHSEELREDIEKLIWHQDEPFASSSIFAQWSVMKLAAKNNVHVLLDGQGADEILAGYPVYHDIWLNELIENKKYKKFIDEILYVKDGSPEKNPLKIAISKLLRNYIKVKRDDTVIGYLNNDYQNIYKNRKKLHQKSRVIDNLQARLISDEKVYNLRKLLKYEDRNSMAYTIESRVPFTDYRLVEFLLSIPSEYKLHKGWTKFIHRKAFQDKLPKNVIWRQDKFGFVTPEKRWMEELKPLIHELFIESKDIKISKYFDILKIQNNLEDFIKIGKKQKTLIWKLINLEIWMRRFF